MQTSSNHTEPFKRPPVIAEVVSATDIMPAITATPVTASSQPTTPPTRQVGRWKKRLLLLGVGVSIVGLILWATTDRPMLLRQPDEVARKFDSEILELAAQIDRQFDVRAQESDLQSAPDAPWNVVARRLSLAMVGNSMSLEEYRALERIEEADRVAWWTEYLLSERRWADQFAERWARATVGTSDGPFLIFRRRKYQQWLADQFQANIPYDQIVRKLITAEGSWTDAPEVNFYTVTMVEGGNGKPDPIVLAGRTSRAFLGMRIDCLQCHQDYLGNVKFSDREGGEPRSGEQADFHELAAYFARVRMENPFRGLRNTDGEYRYRFLNANDETIVSPDVPFEQDLCPTNRHDRESLANWITHPENRPFARATVNRVWAILFGRPLVRPIDDIPLNGPFPPGLEILADDFAKHGYDLHRLIRVIVATRVFQRDSRLGSGSDEPTLEHEEAWAVFPMTQLRPEQMAASILQACRLKAIDASSSIISQLEMFGGVRDFTQAYGDRGEDEFEEEAVTIPQRLLMMNGGFISERIKNDPVLNAPTRIAGLTASDASAIESAYLAALNRMPEPEERELFGGRLRGKVGPARSEALGSMYWVLLNSTEFQWNH
jgi:hypothetical protein